MYESRYQPPLPRRHFTRRMLLHALLAAALLVFSLGLGVAGYMGFERLSLVDAILNSAMLLGGMGPVNAPVTVCGKLFASAYALYAGLVFIVTAALLFTPMLHGLMHRLHWEENA